MARYIRPLFHPEREEVPAVEPHMMGPHRSIPEQVRMERAIERRRGKIAQERAASLTIFDWEDLPPTLEPPFFVRPFGWSISLLRYSILILILGALLQYIQWLALLGHYNPFLWAVDWTWWMAPTWEVAICGWDPALGCKWPLPREMIFLDWKAAQEAATAVKPQGWWEWATSRLRWPR